MLFNYLSLFSGFGGAELAFEPLGWKCLAVSEVDPTASSVLKHHWPDIPNLGDVNTIDGHDLRGQVDLMIGGCPCQSFSVAGLRKSLDDDRGNLTLKYVELAHAIDPLWTIFENVPGILSTSDNAFGCFLGRLVGADSELIPSGRMRWTNSGVVTGPKRTAAWRILDAKYFGVAQRRRRVFVVSVRGARNWRCAQALFPFATSVQGNIAPSREKRQRLAGCLKGGTGERGYPDPSDGNGGGLVDVAGTLGGGSGTRGYNNSLDVSGAFIPYASSSHGGYDEGVGTLRSNGGDLGGGQRDNNLPCADMPSSEGRRSNIGQLCGDWGFP